MTLWLVYHGTHMLSVLKQLILWKLSDCDSCSCLRQLLHSLDLGCHSFIPSHSIQVITGMGKIYLFTFMSRILFLLENRADLIGSCFYLVHSWSFQFLIHKILKRKFRTEFFRADTKIFLLVPPVYPFCPVYPVHPVYPCLARDSRVASTQPG